MNQEARSRLIAGSNAVAELFLEDPDPLNRRSARSTPWDPNRRIVGERGVLEHAYVPCARIDDLVASATTSCCVPSMGDSGPSPHQPGQRRCASPRCPVVRRARSPGTRAVYDDGVAEVRFDDERYDMIVTCGDLATMVCCPGEGTADVSVGRWDVETRRLVSGPMLTLALLEVFRRHGLFSLHAAAVTNTSGKVVLLAGPSGARKLDPRHRAARAGWGFLGDDTVFLRVDAGEVVVCSFPDQADVTDATVEMFPELAALLAQAPHP